MKFTVNLIPDMEDGGYAAACPAIPGCISDGETVEEALANIKEAIEVSLESLAARSQPLPEQGLVIVATVDVEIPSRNWREWRISTRLSAHLGLIIGEFPAACQRVSVAG